VGTVISERHLRDMRALYLVKTGKLEWRDVPAPTLRGPGEAVVRPLAAARCDLDAAVVAGEAPFRGKALHWLRDHLPEALGQRRMFRNAPFKGPFAFGHECVAEVLAVGDEVAQVRPGDRVIVPFQISCGACHRCRRGLTASCTGVPARSMYGFGALGGTQWGGVIADQVWVPFADAMLVPLPAGVDPVAVASASDNIADGHRAVAEPLAERGRVPVLVVGGGAQSIGLYAAAIAVAAGAERVDYVDHDRDRLALAARVGARPLERVPRDRYPITVDASADPRGLASALLAAEPGGLCTSVGIYYTPTTPIPLLAMYGNGVTFRTGRVDARVELPKVLALLAKGFDPSVVTTRVAAWDQAPEAMHDRGAKLVLAA
jgi:threonine dehydrogenase-like Zn-dependent dehydrogenase